MSGSAAANAIDEAARRRVEVEHAEWPRPGIAKPVQDAARSGKERPGPATARLAVAHELDLALEDVERVDVVLVDVRVDAAELRREGQVESRDLRQVAEDSERAHVVLDELCVGGAAEDRILERPASVGGWVELVERGIASADVVAEAHRRHVEVEEDRGRVTRVPERVHDVWRRGGDRPRGHFVGCELRTERDLDLAFQHVERVGVVLVDVGVGPLLAGLVAEPRDDEVLELEQDPQRPLGAVGDDLAFARS